MAVARGLLAGAAVAGLIWEYCQAKTPAFTSKAKIIEKSQPFGIPPIVASKQLSGETKARIQQLLFSMHQDLKGKKLLGG
jgi:phosphonate transport system substrate-binding protein